MKRLLCLLLALAVLLPGSAAVADPEEWEYQTNGDYTIRYPSYIQIYSVLEEDYGWNMDVLEDPEGTDSTGSTVGIIILFAGADDWTDWMETGAFPDERGNAEIMSRMPADEIPADIDAGMDLSYALFLSEDGERMVEAFVFDPEEGDTDYVVTCRYPAYDDGEYSDVFHWMIETLTFANASGSGPSGVTIYSDETGHSDARGSFSVSDVWNNDGTHTVVKDVIVDKKAENMYWICAESNVTKFKVEKLTWNHNTFKVKKAKQLYTRKKLAAQEAISIRDWLPEILPTVRIRAVNSDGIEEVWYVTTNEENGDIILLSEEEMSTDVAISEANFPDAKFREYVKQFDKNKDGSISIAEADSVTCIDVSEMGISDLKGAEHFPYLTELICWDNQLTSLDVSRNTKLTDLDCQNNQLKTLNVSNCADLITLICNGNQLTTLDVSQSPALTLLWCGDNELTSLDVSGNPELSSFNCSGNRLTQLDVSGNLMLDTLVCGGNQLTQLDVSRNSMLSGLACNDNRLTVLDLSQNTMLYSLDCFNNQLTALKLNADALVYLNCYGNQLEQLDIGRCEILRQLTEETAPGTNEEGRYGWWKTYEWGVIEKCLFADETVKVVADGSSSYAAEIPVDDGNYGSGLGMTIQGFINRYNAVQAPSGAPYKTLGEPQKWTTFNEYQVAWFYPDDNSSVLLLLLTKDTSSGQSASMGLDMINICTGNPDDFAALISVTARCAELFASGLTDYSMANYSTAELIRYYYENNLKQNGLTAQRPLDTDSRYYLSFTYYSSTKEYYYKIFPAADAL